jgi:molybdopterin/thiamine biosynthesis adenylyltransferase
MRVNQISHAMSANGDASGLGPELTASDRARYEWQMWTPGVGEDGQRRLKGASVLISRVGGVGGLVAYELAAAGIGKLVLAHGGIVKPADLNRQLLMTHGALGSSRIASASLRLRELRPDLEIVEVAENASQDNARWLVEQADVVVDCAPLFSERFALNAESVRQQKPMVECAMYAYEATLTTFIPGDTPCLRCLYASEPEHWRREFPVFGAVAGTVGCLAAVEVIKLITGTGLPLTNRMLAMDLGSMNLRCVRLGRDPRCEVCGVRPAHGS